MSSPPEIEVAGGDDEAAPLAPVLVDLVTAALVVTGDADVGAAARMGASYGAA